MAIYNGSLLRLTVDGKNIYHSTEASVSLSREFKERSTKDTDGIEIAPGVKSWSASCSALAVLSLDTGVSASENATFADLFDAYDGETAIDVEFTTGTTGDVYYKGKAFIESLEMSAPNEEDATASISLRGSGVVEKATVA